MMSLPILSSRFFEKHAPDVGFFSKWSALYSWSEKILPVYEWSGVLFIGCLQPPENFPQMGKLKVVFVLCEPRALQNVWFELQTGDKVSNRAPAPAAAFSPVADLPVLDGDFSDASESLPVLEESNSEADADAVSFKTVVFKKDSIQEPSAEDEEKTHSLESDLELDLNQPLPNLNTQPAIDFPALPESPAAEKPEDLFSLEESEDESENEKTEQIETSEEESANELLDLSLGGLSSNPLSESPSSVSLQRLGSSPLVATASEPVSEESADQQTEPALEAVDLDAGPSKNEITQNIIEKTQNTIKKAVAAIEEQVEDITQGKRAIPVKSEVILQGEVTRISHAALNATPAPKLEAWMTQVFSEMHKKFQKSMLLLKNGDNARPWKWDATFAHPAGAQNGISLVQPSPFRIVSRTKKPYHGYVVESDASHKFFAEWNDSALPEHLTIVPILVDDHVIGMLLAIGDKSADNKESLMLAENVAESMARQIKAQPQMFRAA